MTNFHPPKIVCRASEPQPLWHNKWFRLLVMEIIHLQRLEIFKMDAIVMKITEA